MTLTVQIFDQALAMSGNISVQQRQLLHALSTAAESALTVGIRQEQSEAFRETMVTAGALYALAAFLEADEEHALQSFSAGDLTIHCRNGSEGADTLREQARRMLDPYRIDRFAFRRV